MIGVIRNKIPDEALRSEIYVELITIIESEKLITTRLLVGEDKVFDDALKKVHEK